MSKRVPLLFTLCLAAIVAASPAHAQGSFELGGFGSYTKFDTSLGLSGGGGGGARLSLISGSGWTTFLLEAEGAYAQSSGTPTIRYIPARARLAYALPVGDMASIVLGVGGVRNQYMSDGVESVSEWGYSGLAGFRLRLGSYMALRIDGVYDYIANPASGIDKVVNQGVQAGLHFPLWVDRRAPERREEPRAQRVPEPQPEPKVETKPEPQPEPRPEPKPEPKTDQPDADKDGVADVHDSCSATPPGMMVDRAGCPVFRDSDNDGIVDARDACPGTPAGAEIDGRGCLLAKDVDRDGIADSADRCPNTAVGDRVDATGCTIPVPVAKPEPTPAPAPAPKPMERTVTLRGVTFASGRDELTPSSHAVLDELARQLIQATSIKLEIGGHTDAQGSHTANVRLSLARAEAVRAYLVMRGVPADRLVARGYGPDMPIASNATASGRAMNRRVELRRIE